MKEIKKLLARLTIFDWLIGLVLLGAFIFFLPYLLKQERWVKTEVKMTPEQWWWESSAPPYWLADSLRVGDSGYDSWGRKEAEITDVKNLEWGLTRKEIYLTVKLRVSYDRRTKVFKFHYRPLEVGQPLELELRGVRVVGLATYIEGVPDMRKSLTLKVAVKSPNNFPWVADAIKINDEMKDTQARVVAKVLDKKVELSKELTITSKDIENAPVTVKSKVPLFLLMENPLRRDITLTLEIKATEINGLLYFRDGQMVKVGEPLWLKFSGVDVDDASIMEIIQ